MDVLDAAQLSAEWSQPFVSIFLTGVRISMILTPPPPSLSSRVQEDSEFEARAGNVQQQ